MFHVAKVTMENGEVKVPQALAGTRAAVDAADTALIQLDVAVSDVAGYVRRGDDLVIQLKSGEVIVLADYFDDGNRDVPVLDLLTSNGEYVPIEFGTSAAADGVLTPAVGVAGVGAAGAAGAAGAFGGLGAAGLAGLGALALGGVVAVAGGSGGGNGNGNGGGGSDSYVSQPEITLYGPEGMSGTGKPGDTITIHNETTGQDMGSVTIPDDGNWSITFDPRPGPNDHLTVTETSPEGGTSEPVDLTPGTARPEAPDIDQYGPDKISGTGKPGHTVKVTDETTGKVIGETTVKPDGTWSITPDPKPSNGDQVVAVQSDPNGYDSPGTEVTIGANRPPAPEIDQYGPDSFSGTGTPGDTVTLVDESTGQQLGQVEVGPDGKWSIEPNPKPGNGDQVTAVETDKNGNDSQGSDVTIGANRPDAPTIDQYGPDAITGTGTPGNSVTVTDETTGQVIGKGTVGEDGTWSITPDPKPSNGDQVTAVQSDANGNDSLGADVTIGTNRPDAPDAHQEGTTLMGTGTPGDSITIVDKDTGQVVGKTTVGDDGKWSTTLSPAPANNAGLSVTQTDKNGNDSQPDTVTWDAVAPASATIAASDGAAITGLAEPGTTVTIEWAGGKETVQVTGDTFNYTFPSKLPDGTAVTVTLKDAAGNVSEPVTVVTDTDGSGSGIGAAAMPAAPSISASNGTVVSGSAPIGTTVMLDLDGDGTSDASVATKADGTWSYTPSTPLADGTAVTAWTQDSDATPQVSSKQTMTVDAHVPDTPVFFLSHGISAIGTGTPGSEISVDSTGDGVADFTTTVGADGTWEVKNIIPRPQDKEGDPVHVWATDPETGAMSGRVEQVVDATAPGNPDITAAGASMVTGTVDEAFATMLLDQNGDGVIDVTTTADSAGNWSFTGLSLANGTEIAVRSMDGSENKSLEVKATVDTTVPTVTIENSELNDDFTINLGDSVDVRSSEKGTVYLVNDQVTVNSLNDITSAKDSWQNAVQITDETQSFVLDTDGLEGGNATYHAYAVDLDDNLSPISEMALTIV
ncbi:Ig-like domain-containing protein [Pelagibacterium halotolerans]|uniref:Ig-like domain-containing protein n=1 Tax=Pelagibacterium halotolerans TaxID=531813 RepID=UPI00384EC79F